MEMSYDEVVQTIMSRNVVVCRNISQRVGGVHPKSIWMMQKWRETNAIAIRIARTATDENSCNMRIPWMARLVSRDKLQTEDGLQEHLLPGLKPQDTCRIRDGKAIRF